MKGVKVTGIDKTIRTKLDDKNAAEDADRLAEGSMRRIGADAANMAPVKTGHLRNTLTSEIQRSTSAPKGVWDLLQGTDYTMVQEFEHKSKRRFIYRAVLNEEPRFRQTVGERFKKGK